MSTMAENLKVQYWEKLSKVASVLAVNCSKLLKHEGRVFGNILDGGELWYTEFPEVFEIQDAMKLEPVDAYLAKNLLENLVSEFPEFQEVKDWREINKDNINTTMINTLYFVAHRKTFHESCEVSKSWQSGPKEDSDEPCIPTSEAIDLFFELKADLGLKDSTEKTNLKRLKPFAAMFTFLPLDDDTIRTRFLKRYKNLSQRYQRNIYDTLVDFYSTIGPRYQLPGNPMDKIGRPQANGTERPLHPLKSEWLPKLFKAVSTENELLALQTELGAGWRPGEFRAIKAIDVREVLYREDPLIIVHGKERAELTPLLPETLELLSHLTPPSMSDHEHIIRNKHRQPMGEKAHTDMIYGLYKQAGIPTGSHSGFIPYDLRDTFGSLVLRWSRDYWLTERLMRHDMPGEGKKYFKYPLDQLCEDLQLFSPVGRIQGADLRPPVHDHNRQGGVDPSGEGGTRTPTPCGT